jgi:hypothetical protein
MKLFRTTVFFALGLLGGSDAIACSCGPRENVKSAVREAAVVVIADVVSIEQHRIAREKDSSDITEEVKFRVVETFKGPKKPGDLLSIRSNLGPAGSCGISAKNSPVWLEAVKDGKSTATRLSGRWVIFGYGKSPFELNMCGHSAPMESGGEYAVRRLRALSKHMTKPSGESKIQSSQKSTG